MELRADLSVFGLGDDFLVFSEEAQRLAILNHSAGTIVRRLMAGAHPDEIAREFVSKGLAAPEHAPLWVADSIETLRANGLTTDGSTGAETESTAPSPNSPTVSEIPPPPPPFEIVAERTYRLLGTRALVRFGLKAQIAWVEAALEHLATENGEPPNVIFDIPGEELPNGRRFATVYRDGQCLQANVRLFCIGPIVKSALWQSAVNAHDFLFNFHAGVVDHADSCVLLPGAAGSGKSSLTAALTHSGFEYFSDEVALIEPQTFNVPRVPLALGGKELDIPDSHDPITTGFEKSRSLRVVFAIGSVVALTPIEFDNEFDAVTRGIGDIWPDRRLSAEMESVTFKFPKITPKQTLFIGCAAPWLARSITAHNQTPTRKMLRIFRPPHKGEANFGTVSV